MNRAERRAAERAARKPRRPLRRPYGTQTYSRLHWLFADPANPLPPERRRHQLLRMHQGLDAMTRDATPQPHHWRLVSDAVNLLETLVEMGAMADETGLVRDCVRELAIAGARHVQDGQPLRLSGAGIQTLRDALHSYGEALVHLDARTMIEAHARTERRVQDILAGRGRPDDVQVVAV